MEFLELAYRWATTHYYITWGVLLLLLLAYEFRILKKMRNAIYKAIDQATSTPISPERAEELAKLQQKARDKQQARATEASAEAASKKAAEKNTKTEKKGTILDADFEGGGTSLLAGTASATGNWRPTKKSVGTCSTCS